MKIKYNRDMKQIKYFFKHEIRLNCSKILPIHAKKIKSQRISDDNVNKRECFINRNWLKPDECIQKMFVADLQDRNQQFLK